MTLTFLTILTLVTAAVALYDGIARVRGKRGNSILAIVEIVAAALLAIGVFVSLPSPIGPLLLSIILEVVLVLVLVVRGTGARRVAVVTLAAIILNTVLLLTLLGWLNIPGLG